MAGAHQVLIWQWNECITCKSPYICHMDVARERPSQGVARGLGAVGAGSTRLVGVVMILDSRILHDMKPTDASTHSLMLLQVHGRLEVTPPP